MICRKCKDYHTEKPDSCPHGCACQHKGVLVKPEVRREPEPILMGWECRKCGVLIKDWDNDPCACYEPDASYLIEIHDTDL